MRVLLALPKIFRFHRYFHSILKRMAPSSSQCVYLVGAEGSRELDQHWRGRREKRRDWEWAKERKRESTNRDFRIPTKLLARFPLLFRLKKMGESLTYAANSANNTRPYLHVGVVVVKHVYVSRHFFLEQVRNSMKFTRNETGCLLAPRIWDGMLDL